MNSSIVKMKKATLQKNKGKINQPNDEAKKKQCLATLVKIGDLEAWALWDSGSTISGITPSFAHVAKVRVTKLLDPHILQLETVGS